MSQESDINCPKSLLHDSVLSDPMDWSPPGSSVHGSLQARTLEGAAMPSSRGSSQSRDGTQVSRIADRFLTIWATREAFSISGMDKFQVDDSKPRVSGARL